VPLEQTTWPDSTAKCDLEYKARRWAKARRKPLLGCLLIKELMVVELLDACALRLVAQLCLLKI
jgi:hypothetical protein